MTAVQERTHRLNVPDSVWRDLQVLAKENDTSCSEYASTVLDSMIKQAKRVDQRDPLRARKKNLGCDVNEFDCTFNRAWRWACAQFGSELALVEYLEEQVSLPAPATMHHPRAVVFSRWKRAVR